MVPAAGHVDSPDHECNRPGQARRNNNGAQGMLAVTRVGPRCAFWPGRPKMGSFHLFDAINRACPNAFSDAALVPAAPGSPNRWVLPQDAGVMSL
jgi:hypothetical protein